MGNAWEMNFRKPQYVNAMVAPTRVPVSFVKIIVYSNTTTN